MTADGSMTVTTRSDEPAGHSIDPASSTASPPPADPSNPMTTRIMPSALVAWTSSAPPPPAYAAGRPNERSRWVGGPLTEHVRWVDARASTRHTATDEARLHDRPGDRAIASSRSSRPGWTSPGSTSRTAPPPRTPLPRTAVRRAAAAGQAARHPDRPRRPEDPAWVTCAGRLRRSRAGRPFVLRAAGGAVAARRRVLGDAFRIRRLAADVRIGDPILLADGAAELRVIRPRRRRPTPRSSAAGRSDRGPAWPSRPSGCRRRR